MRKMYLILCCIAAAILLTFGCISVFDTDATQSEVQQRQLKTFPEFSVPDILKGNFWKELVLYYDDTFPARETLLERDWLVNAFFDFGDLKLEQDP